ncbi:bifunctional 2-polyprenyl-6-hydroxyphenol methylase/3-demethylubiquinol 3-O-methyltransferase UbiG [Mycolicibacterium sp. F2034L]|uniref:class I SAM-dependent methyltransferase n=1 Tax=Mycolicibacterium sp. F2034L TaxID=2926422 RepID=UPI001FF3466B|nr:class I SAM-dependent methyltransferase [Mycolicibacterium sp. F2034L]MCK0174937.1 methyltransferase domain-containing protein [Mycolicibacterium sp. F2034L]
MVESNVAQEWDERYAAAEQLFSGQPNTVLISEVSGLPPGRALDVGCGEGADAVWLAAQGWTVTALDVSRVAVERAAARAARAGVEVAFVRNDLVAAELPADGFDLVTAQYPALRSSADRAAERALTAAVAPGGVLLVVHHAGVDEDTARARGFDPADYVFPADVRAVLGDGWEVRFEESRPRDTPLGGAEHRHTHDAVLFARRLQ